MKRKTTILEDATPGPLPGKDVTWRCWPIRGHVDRRRTGDPVEVRAPTAFLAQRIAAVLLPPEPDNQSHLYRRLGTSVRPRDPLHVEVELAESTANGARA